MSTLKKIASLALAIIIPLVIGTIIYKIVGNRQLFDVHNNFKYAILMRYDGEQIVPIKSWRDYEDGDQIQFTSMDGVTYLVHSSDVFLLTDIEN